MKLPDIILVLTLLSLSFLPLAFFSQKNAKTAKITVDNEIYKTVDLNKNEKFIVKNKYGENAVVVENGEIFIENADCRDQICVKRGKIKSSGENIACVPHKLLIEIENNDD